MRGIVWRLGTFPAANQSAKRSKHSRQLLNGSAWSHQPPFPVPGTRFRRSDSLMVCLVVSGNCDGYGRRQRATSRTRATEPPTTLARHEGRPVPAGGFDHRGAGLTRSGPSRSVSMACSPPKPATIPFSRSRPPPATRPPNRLRDGHRGRLCPLTDDRRLHRLGSGRGNRWPLPARPRDPDQSSHRAAFQHGVVESRSPDARVHRCTAGDLGAAGKPAIRCRLPAISTSSS